MLALRRNEVSLADLIRGGALCARMDVGSTYGMIRPASHRVTLTNCTKLIYVIKQLILYQWLEKAEPTRYKLISYIKCSKYNRYYIH